MRNVLSTTPECAAGSGGLAIKAVELGIRYRRYLKKDWTLKDSFLNAFRGTKYESFWAVRGASFEIGVGESVGVIGANGAGKSTLLKAIAGVLPPSEGSISVNGRVAPLLELGAGFRGDLTGRENVYFNGAVMGLNKRDVAKRIERIIEFADIGDFIDAPLQTYSSGMKGRLGFAVATEVDADILVIDETLSTGDEAFKRKAMARTRTFFETNKTVLLVSHSAQQIRELCPNSIYLKQGELISSGPTDEILKHYRDQLHQKHPSTDSE